MTWNAEDYQPAEGMYPCISIQQPFASFIKFGVKSIELRGWSTKYRGPMNHLISLARRIIAEHLRVEPV